MTARTYAPQYIALDGTAWEPSGWARDMLATVARRTDTHQLRTCKHTTTFWTWLAWQPGRLLCHGCTATEAIRITGQREEWTCDRCDTHAPGDCAPFNVPTPTKTMGLVVAWFGLCSPCKTKELT